MSNSTNIIIGTVIIIIGIIMLIRKSSLVTANIDLSNSINLNGIDKIVVNGSSENIRIMKSSSHNLKAELTGTSSGFASSQPTIEIKQTGSTIVVEVKRSIFNLFSSSNLAFDIYIDESFDGDLFFNLSSGKLNVVDNFNVNKLNINLSSGYFTIDEIQTKKTKFSVSSGQLSISNFTGAIDGNVSSGHVSVDYDTFDDDIKLKVSSGSIEINLPEASDFELKARKSSGSVTTEFALKDSSSSSSKFEGIAGNGGNKIDLNMSSGRIEINKK